MTRVVSGNKNTEDGGQCAVDTALRPIRMQASRKDGLIRVPYTLYPTNCNARGERVSCVRASVRLCVCASVRLSLPGRPGPPSAAARSATTGYPPSGRWVPGRAREVAPLRRSGGDPRRVSEGGRGVGSRFGISIAPRLESARARERESAVAPSRFAAPCHGRISKLPLALRAKNRFFTNRRQT